MYKRKISTVEYVGGITGAIILTVIIIWYTNRMTKKHKKKIKPDPFEKERAIEIIENRKDKSPIFATVLFEELNKYLLIQDQPIKAKNLEVIKIIIKDESDKVVFYEVIKNFLICLILDIDFDYIKYRKSLFEICFYEDKKETDKEKLDMAIIYLRHTVEGEYAYIKRIIG
ncbi:hypothetical protein COBT_001296 [Conglomerata obtusa]